MNPLKNKTVFITGASSGIGKACAEQFAEKESRIIICSRQMNEITSLAATLKDKYKTEVYGFQLDVRDKNAVEQAIYRLPENWQKIDILINNAGLASGYDKVHEGDTDDWDKMIDTNVKGLLYITRQVVPLMLKYGIEGHIFNIGSIAGTVAYPNGAVYSATKSAVKFISDGLRMDLVDKPIKVTNIQPGMVETNFSVVRFHGDKQRADSVYRGIKPLVADDIAGIIVYAASAPKHVQICEILVTPLHQSSVLVTYKNQE